MDTSKKHSDAAESIETTSASPVAIIAGNGRLPLEVAHALQEQGRPVLVMGITGEADPAIEQFSHQWCQWERVGQIFKSIKQNGISDIVLAGGVIGRPELKLHRMDWETMRTLPGLLAALIGGDNQILTGVISVIEKRGFKVRNIAELLPQLTVQPGANTSLKPSGADKKRIADGFAVTQAMGAFDIGQACVVAGSRAVAVEGAEGTDSMLSRVAELRSNGRLPNKRAGVLVKAVKPGQDERADLPAIGPETIRAASNAKLQGIGVEAGKTLIIQKEETLRLAQEHKVFIYGFVKE